MAQRTAQRDLSPDDLLADAQFLSAEADRLRKERDLRDAAEKAWGATVAAARAVVLAKTGWVPELTTGLGSLLARHVSMALAERYWVRQGLLHGDCFYWNGCDEQLIEEELDRTQDLIAEARTLIRGH